MNQSQSHREGGRARRLRDREGQFRREHRVQGHVDRQVGFLGGSVTNPSNDVDYQLLLACVSVVAVGWNVGGFGRCSGYMAVDLVVVECGAVGFFCVEKTLVVRGSRVGF